MASGARLLVLGLDGATWDLLDPFIAAGDLPHLARLRREGASGPLRSTTPPMTLPAWSSLLTGCGPGTHGIFDFTRRIPGTCSLEFVNATHRAIPSFLEVLSDRGARVASVAVPGTWPPSALNGVVLSGFDSPVATSADASCCHPRSLHRDLVRRFGGFRYAPFQETHPGPGWHEAALPALLQEIQRKEEVARYLLGRERWDAFMMVFGESDTVAHHFWAFHDPASPRHPADAPAVLRDAIRRVYARLDFAVGRLLDAAAPDVVCVVSDHGVGGAGVHVLYLNNLLARHGWLAWRDRHGRSTRSSRWLPQVREQALRLLPVGAQERLVRALPRPVLGALETRARWGGIDFSRTRAFSDELNYAPSIHLARGTPGGGAGGQAGRDDIPALVAHLLAWEVDGFHPVRQVLTRDRVWRGPLVDRGPDLLLDLQVPDGYSLTVLPSERVAPTVTWRRLAPGEHLGGKGRGMNGTHRDLGVLLLWGGGTRPGPVVDARLEDVVPTLLHLVGQAIPTHVEGRILLEACASAGPAWYAAVVPPTERFRRLSGHQARDLARRLQLLGYL